MAKLPLGATGADQEPALLQKRIQSSSPAQILLWFYRTNLISDREGFLEQTRGQGHVSLGNEGK